MPMLKTILTTLWNLEETESKCHRQREAMAQERNGLLLQRDQIAEANMKIAASKWAVAESHLNLK